MSQSPPVNPVNSVVQQTVKTPQQTLPTTLAELKNWTVGQVFKGTVLKQLTNQTMLLNVGNMQLSAKSPLKLPVGTEVQLKVVQSGDQPLLQLISSAQSSKETSLAALRQAIPKQLPLSDLFTNLKALNSADQRLPQVLQQAIQTLQTSMPSRMDMMNPEGIKKALAESGTFLESNLANSKVTEADLKLNLLRLATLIDKDATGTKQDQAKNNLMALLADNKALPELQRHVESALARIQLNQLNSIPTQEQNTQGFILELPVKEKDEQEFISIKLNEENKQRPDREETQHWAINLSFELKGLGKMHAKLTLGGEQIQASLWAEDDATFTLLEENLPVLKDRLTDVKFVAPKIDCFKGSPEVDNSPNPHYNELIDIEI